MWYYGNYMNINIGNLLKYFATLSVSFHDLNSLFGFFTFLVFFYKSNYLLATTTKKSMKTPTDFLKKKTTILPTFLKTFF